MLLEFWMSQTMPVMALSLAGAMSVLALFLCWLSFGSRFAARAQDWKGVTPPFVGVPATLFGLLMTFLSQDVWDANRRAYQAVALEREQLATLSALSSNNGIDSDGVLRAIHWKALEETFPSTRHQRCWQHKTLNVLDKLPKSVQPNAHQDLREIWLAENRAAAEAAIQTFAEKYAPKYDKAVDCLLKDRDALLTFFDFPAEHWTHLRTSNPIESAFATVRHRTVRMKGALSQDTAHLMVFKLIMAAAKSWRRLQGQNQLPKVVSGVTVRDGIEVASDEKSAA